MLVKRTAFIGFCCKLAVSRLFPLVFQNYNLIDYLTTVENVKLGGSGNADKLLEEVGIGKEYWQRNVMQLSGGQQQRVAIARALASDAHVLLADEPTGNLDETTADEIIALLKKTAHELGKCVIVVTHSKHLAEEADEILEIKNGAISFVFHDRFLISDKAKVYHVGDH